MVVEMAMNYLGTPYRWGGVSPNGFDCSGFMIYLLSYFGVNLNRVSRDMARNGVFVNRNELCLGDLVFFANGGTRNIDHVGMYIGDGRFIHSSTYGTGVVINYVNNPWMNFITARRVL
jgi:cell wall-associated NlpC family hydrolase